MTITTIGIDEIPEEIVPAMGTHVVDDITEDLSPLPGFYSVPTVAVPATHRERTQKLLAMCIVCVLLVLYIAVVGCFLLSGMETDRLIAVVAALSGLQALAAAAVGFYYGSQSSDNK